MSEEPSAGAPVQQPGKPAPDGELISRAEPTEHGSSLSAPRPPRKRRTALIVSIAGVLTAAVVAAIVLLPASQPRQYTGLPEPCTLVSAATLATYMPGAAGGAHSLLTSSTHQKGVCTWSSITGREDLNLSVDADIYSSSTGLTQAQQAFNAEVRAFDENGNGITVTTRSVTGIGDQATVMFITGTGTGSSGAMHAVGLFARSDNADIHLTYTISPYESAPPPPTKAALLADALAMTRNVMAALTGPAAIPPRGPKPLEPQYATPRNTCTLITAATLAKYLPGATRGTPLQNSFASPSAGGVPQDSNCGWITPGESLVVEVSVYSPAGGFTGPQEAQQAFGYAVESDSQQPLVYRTHSKITGTRPATGLGDQATAIFQTDYPGPDYIAELIIWSGNAEIQINYSSIPTPFGSPLATTAAPLYSGAIVMAGEVLAAMPAS
jgi:hypothetical protein